MSIKLQQNILQSYTKQLLAKIEEKLTDHPTYGVEIEFLPARVMNPEDMERLELFLPKEGFIKSGATFISDKGLCITFEPGGQIEYCTPPVSSDNFTIFERFFEQILQMNSKILKKLNIEYVATDYIPNRADTPVCLKAKRYTNLHNRLGFTGTRGREMMKGTASIHLHTGLRTLDKIPLIYKTLCRMAESRDFIMSQERKDIWENTDPLRCDMPEIDLDHTDTWNLLEKIVHHALSAPDLYQDIPLYQINDLTFNYFLIHLTTIFTSVRLNMKGPTFELRTLDSMPVNKMSEKLKLFINILEKNL